MIWTILIGMKLNRRRIPKTYEMVSLASMPCYTNNFEIKVAMLRDLEQELIISSKMIIREERKETDTVSMVRTEP